MRARPEDYPEGSPIRKQIEAALAAQGPVAGVTRESIKRAFPEEDLQREIIAEADSTPMATLLDRTFWPPEVVGSMLGRWIYHVPNGGGRSAIEAAILIGLGVRPGVWDLCLWIPVRRVLLEEFPSGTRGRTERVREEFRGGLYLELKAGRNGLTEKQRDFGERARLVSHDTAEVRTIYQFREAVAAYFRGARPIC